MAYFGTTAGGEKVEKISLSAGDLQVDLLTWGAVLQSVRLKGVAYDLTLGSDQLADYEGALCYNGALIAPIVNRLSDARAPLSDRTLQLQVNFNGRHCLHSGDAGTHRKNWKMLHATPSEALMAVDLPDGEGGFSGNRHLEVLFQVEAPATLRMTVTATTDAETIINTANHSYWNLDGSGTLTGHSLQLAADHYLPVTEDFVASGEVRPVSGAFDFRKPQPIAPHQPDLDNCFCVSHDAAPLRDVLWLRGASGLAMTLATTEAGVQVYDCRHDGFKGLAIEAHAWPDSPNKPGFASITLLPGEERRQITEWRFDRG
jgi:aldose 1-epimerase